jgi:hypothetical protein
MLQPHALQVLMEDLFGLMQHLGRNRIGVNAFLQHAIVFGGRKRDRARMARPEFPRDERGQLSRTRMLPRRDKNIILLRSQRAKARTTPGREQCLN